MVDNITANDWEMSPQSLTEWLDETIKDLEITIKQVTNSQDRRMIFREIAILKMVQMRINEGAIL